MHTEATRTKTRRGRGCGWRLLVLFLLAVVAALCWQVYTYPELIHTEVWGWRDLFGIGAAATVYPTAADTKFSDTAAPRPTAAAGEVSEDTKDALRDRAREDRRYKPLSRHPDDYPEGLLRQVLRNDEVLDFALAYPENVGKTWEPADISLAAPEGMSHSLQWEARWGYGAYGSSVVGVSGCGPTCLSMAVVGLTGNTGANPLAVARFSEEQGWYVPGVGTDWELMRSGAEHYGLRWQELSPEADALRGVLDAGGCVIASMLPGDFTASGHFILISAYTPEGFQVLDPNSVSLSRVWEFDALKSQFAALWGYTVS